MRRGGGGYSGKMNAHVWLLEPFKRWGLRFLFCKHKLTRFFSARKQMFFLGWGRGVAYGEGDGEKHYSDKGPTSFVVILRLLNLVTEFTPVTTILFFAEWDMWWRRFDRNFPENGNLIAAKWKQAAGILKLPQFCLDCVAMEIFSITFFYTHKFKRVTSIRTHFASVNISRNFWKIDGRKTWIKSLFDLHSLWS